MTIDQLMDQVWDLQEQLKGSIHPPEKRMQLKILLADTRRALYDERLKARQPKSE
jgi:hypothetical protein